MAPPDSWEGPDPLAGRWLVPDDDDDDLSDISPEDAELYNAYEEDDLNELARDEGHEYWAERDDDL